MSARILMRLAALVSCATYSLPAFAGGVELNVGTASGSAGSTVQIPIAIVRAGETVTAVSNLIQYDNTKFTPGTCVAQNPFAMDPPGGNSTAAGTLNGKICSNFPPADDCSVDADCSGGALCNVNSVVSLSLADADANMIPDAFVADGTFVLCPFTITMGTTPGMYPFLQNVATYSDPSGTVFSASGTLGSITVLACIGSGADTDADGYCDDSDNCPYTSNPSQSDLGGHGAGSAPDGIGDACQCGDVVGTDGRVTLTDSVAILRSLLMPPTATLLRPSLCDVGPAGPTVSCTLTDSVIVLRSLLMPPTATVLQHCAPANP